MRAFLLVVLGVATATPEVAWADDAACSVRVLEAPPEARDAIASWVAGERTCTELDVRVTPTGDGYALWAHTRDGRTFQRWVPDAKTVALLVVSWAGDDSVLPAPLPPPRSQYTLRTHVRQEVPQPTALASATTAPATAKRDIVVAVIARPGSGEDVDGRTGIRVSVDLSTHDQWRAGIAGMASSESVRIYSYVGNGSRIATAYEPRVSAIGYLARVSAGGHIRVAVGAGLLYTQLTDVAIDNWAGNEMVERRGILAPAAELSGFASLPLSRAWAFTAGIVMTVSTDRVYQGLLVDPNQGFAVQHDNNVHFVGALGVARSL